MNSKVQQPTQNIQGKAFKNTLELESKGGIYSMPAVAYLEPTVSITRAEFKVLSELDIQYPLTIALCSAYIAHIATQLSSVERISDIDNFWKLTSIYLFCGIVLYVVEKNIIKQIYKKLKKGKFSTIEIINSKFEPEDGDFVYVKKEKYRVHSDDQG
jgi:hypothetical protein